MFSCHFPIKNFQLHPSLHTKATLVSLVHWSRTSLIYPSLRCLPISHSFWAVPLYTSHTRPFTVPEDVCTLHLPGVCVIWRGQLDYSPFSPLTSPILEDYRYLSWVVQSVHTSSSPVHSLRVCTSLLPCRRVSSLSICLTCCEAAMRKGLILLIFTFIIQIDRCPTNSSKLSWTESNWTELNPAELKLSHS